MFGDATPIVLSVSGGFIYGYHSGVFSRLRDSTRLTQRQFVHQGVAGPSFAPTDFAPAGGSLQSPSSRVLMTAFFLNH